MLKNIRSIAVFFLTCFICRAQTPSSLPDADPEYLDACGDEAADSDETYTLRELYVESKFYYLSFFETWKASSGLGKVKFTFSLDPTIGVSTSGWPDHEFEFGNYIDDGWTYHSGKDFGGSDIEVIYNWEDTYDLESLKDYVEANGYQGFALY